MIIVTGASSGLGRKYIENIRTTETILGFYNSTKPSENFNKNIDYEKLDLSNFDQIKNFFDLKKYDFSNIKILNFASVKSDKLIGDVEKQDIDNFISVNLTSNLLLVKFLLPVMINNKFGRIIHFSSTKAMQGDKGTSIYSMGKSGLLGLSKSICKEYGRFNITSNVISLGYFDSPLWNKLNVKKKNDLLREVPSKKIGNINNIITLTNAIFSCEYLNGSLIKLDGGI